MNGIDTPPGPAPSRPRATARLQLHAGFTLDDARAQVGYFAALGVSHLYLSPITRARAGSTHGYDVIDHGQVSPELGGEAALRRLAQAARAHGLGLIADIVPNHMAADVSNAWWADALRRGERSTHSRCFDIDWRAPDPALRGKVLLPVLPEPYGVCLEAGMIVLAHDPQHGYAIDVGGQRYPVAEPPPPAQNPAHTCAAHAADSAAGRRRLHHLLERQHYRLAWWRAAPDQINWRRFFEIHELVGVRVEDDLVFDAVHALPLRLYREGLLDGLRIDHIDGLASPGAYLKRLHGALLRAAPERARAGLPVDPYMIVEKILGDNESLDPRWQADGTTGYDFMDQVGALLHAPAARDPLTRFWETLSGDPRPAAAQLRAARELMLARHFASERLVLVRALTRVARLDLRTRDWAAPAIDRALTALMAAFPVYRSYAEDGGRGAADRIHWQTALAGARAALAAAPDSPDDQLLALLDQWLDGSPGEPCEADAANALRNARARALRHFQQLTPPLAAKALEDTLFYRYGPLLSRNEVGASPTRFSLEPAAFLAACAVRGRSHPDALLATATHDHKRGEDSRCRLAALSEIPQDWIAAASGWIERLPGREQRPSRADRYLLLQTLVGAWPLELAPRRHRRPPGRGRRLDRARRAVATEGPARSQAAHALDRPRPALRRRRQPGARRAADHARRQDTAARDRRLRAAPGASRTGQQPGPDPAAQHAARRAGPVPRRRPVGFQPGRSRQPPAGRLCPARGAAGRCACRRRHRRQRGRLAQRRGQAGPDPARVGRARPPSGPAARGHAATRLGARAARRARPGIPAAPRGPGPAGRRAAPVRHGDRRLCAGRRGDRARPLGRHPPAVAGRCGGRLPGPAVIAPASLRDMGTGPAAA